MSSAGLRIALVALLAAAPVAVADDAEHMTALHYAALRGRAEMAELLLERGADACAVDRHGWTPLHAAARSGHASVAAILVRALSAAEIDQIGRNGQSALHRAAFWGALDVARVLVGVGADINKRDAARQRPLDIAGAAAGAAIAPQLQRLLDPRAALLASGCAPAAAVR